MANEARGSIAGKTKRRRAARQGKTGPAARRRRDGKAPPSATVAPWLMVAVGVVILIAGVAIGAALGLWLPPSETEQVAAAPPPPEAKPKPAPPKVARTAATPPRFDDPPPARLERTAPVRVFAATESPPRAAPGRVAVLSDGARRASDAAAEPVPAWRRHAVAAVLPEGRALIAIVIDDLGLNRAGTARAIDLPGPLTLAFLPYAEALPAQTARARAAGHELLMHQPMEPIDDDEDPGPYALMTGQDEAEILRRLRWGLDRFEGYVGVNNHMGSRFTTWAPGMRAVMGELGARGLLFLDSRTITNSLGDAMAQEAGVPHLRRHVFLDNDLDVEAIEAQLRLTEEIARRDGYAIAIGHPQEATLAALEGWLPGLRERGFVLAPIAALVARQRAGSE